MAPFTPIDFSAVLLAFSIPYAYFRSKAGEKMVERPKWLALFAAECVGLALLLLSSWQLAANLIIWAIVLVALREF
jgi:hypothetical protein